MYTKAQTKYRTQPHERFFRVRWPITKTPFPPPFFFLLTRYIQTATTKFKKKKKKSME